MRKMYQFEMQSKNYKIYVNPFLAAIEIGVIIYILRLLPSYPVYGYSVIEYAIVLLLILFGLLVSLFLHEYAHLLAARYAGLPVQEITLSLYGACISFKAEPSTAKASLLIALAGPFMNFLAAVTLYSAHLLFTGSAVLNTVFLSLGIFNGILSAYNLLPVMPLDGGYIVRALFWGKGSTLIRSNQIASRIAYIFIFLCFMGGIFSVFESHYVISVIVVLLGISLGLGARSAYQRVITEQVLSMLCPGGR